MNGPQDHSRGTVIFDLDGTLVDSIPDLAGSLDSLMADKGLEAIGIVAARKLIGHGIPNLVRGALALRGVDWDGQGAADIKRFTDIYAQRVSRETRPYADVEQTLSLLAQDGWRMAVCTNKMERYAKTIIRDLGLDVFFSIIAGPDTFGFGKPDPRHLLETARAVGADGPVIFVGDSEVDIATAKAAGVPIVAVSYGYSKAPLASLLPDALVDRFADLPAGLNRILAQSVPDQGQAKPKRN
ncbi:phosphoglycolate phosphatase [Mesorhizobium sp. SEMIA 3007]|uniref:HAD-IA family hydrolase n=1 Tax=Mesorhizobium sp. SEMIA 3007 TaxID=1862350 RepID=UPI00083D4139|nr:HAD-IA family hydrolase [Mesorhizobium sp. SEMIA 3007]ODA93770.1 phosphoglycolate phosphatase [Mesorhizobium sp. SEMIA 3007]